MPWCCGAGSRVLCQVTLLTQTKQCRQCVALAPGSWHPTATNQVFTLHLYASILLLWTQHYQRHHTMWCCVRCLMFEEDVAVFSAVVSMLEKGRLYSVKHLALGFNRTLSLARTNIGDRHIDTHTDGHTDTHRLTGRQTQTHKRARRHTQTDRHTHTHTHTHTLALVGSSWLLVLQFTTGCSRGASLQRHSSKEISRVRP